MKKIGAFLVCLILVLQIVAVGNVFAANISGNQEYKPLDMVVVVDTSGSMKYSDSTRMTPSAVNMLINMMPAEDSRIGIVTFNTKPTGVTCDANGNPALLSLKEFSNVKDIKNRVNAFEYDGGTGIGNALKMATDILAQNSKDAGRQKAIILFTDGMDDFDSDLLSLSRCKENQGTAVQWATSNNCPVYCIGYNYQNSMGSNSEGIKKLESISKPTQGQAKAITNIKEIEDMFVNMLANICNLYYKVIDTIPGDGKRHEIEIPVSPEVIEANIRITCATDSALSKGKIELYNPNNEKVQLHNGNGIRYDVDATAVSIKVMAPKTGTWKLVLDGIQGEEIKIGLLEHYELGIVSNLTLPEGNPKDVAYIGDTIGVQAYLTTDGNKVSDNLIYETVTSARVVVTPRAAPEQQVVYALNFDGSQYAGSFEITMDSVYDVNVEIASESFIRTDSLVIKSSNHPLILEKNIENVKLNKNKQLVIDDIYTYVSDPEQDSITAEVTNSTDPDMAKVEIKDDKIIIDGLGWGATTVTVTYKDAHGNTVDTTFKVSVNDPVAWAIIILILLLIAAVVLYVLYKVFESRLKICGFLVLEKLEILDDVEEALNLEFKTPYDEYSEGYEPIIFDLQTDFYRKKARRNLGTILEEICKCFRNFSESDNRTKAMVKIQSPDMKSLFMGIDKVALIGTTGGKKGFYFKLPGKRAKYLRLRNVNKGKVHILDNMRFEVKFDNNIERNAVKKHTVIMTFNYSKI